ncbi:MAG: hypothetical protein JKX84_08905, partial [Flavobacteriales bacterium]|nr:hypothetical protein [Flavobacteriales bacterium]
MSEESPYLSLVLTGRNDNYGGDFRSRLQRCVSNAFEQLIKHGISSELIFLNYNPVNENAPIAQFIDWPTSTEKVSVRIITISNEIHRHLVADGSRKSVPVLEYLGKNAGIKRAKGQFILSMNPDIILPSELVFLLKKLRKDTYYRTDRIDFEGDLNAEHQLQRIFLKGQDYPINNTSQITELRFKNSLLNRWKVFTPRIKGLLNRFSKTVYYDNRECRFHCNVSGDFMLMHRDHWHTLNGHNEQAFMALHVDSLMVIQAAFLPLKEKVLHSPIFHQEHTRRYDANLDNPEFKRAWDIYRSEAAEIERSARTKVY